jgi:hypothetical protein
MGCISLVASEKVRLWSKKGEILAEKNTPELLWGIDWEQDNQTLVTTDEQGKVTFWNNELDIIKEIKY